MEKMFEAMDITEDKRAEIQESFDNAVLKKTTLMMETYVEKEVNERVEVLEEEYKEKVLMLEDSLDGYLDTVVEEFIDENAPVYEAQIQDEKAKTLLEMFDDMVKVVGIDMLTIQEGKEERTQEEFEESAEFKVEELTEKNSGLVDKLVEAKREADKYLKGGLINELKDGMSILEGEKFEKLAGLVPFERGSSYLDKLETLKESILDSRVETTRDEDSSLPGVAFKQPEPVDVAQATNYDKYL